MIGDSSDKLYERFWLCERCAKEMTLVWAGTHVQLIPLTPNPSCMQAVSCNKVVSKGRTRTRLGMGETRS